MGTWQIKNLAAFTKILLSFLNKQIVTCPWLISQVLQKFIFDNVCEHLCCFYLFFFFFIINHLFQKKKKNRQFPNSYFGNPDWL